MPGGRVDGRSFSEWTTKSTLRTNKKNSLKEKFFFCKTKIKVIKIYNQKSNYMKPIRGNVKQHQPGDSCFQFGVSLMIGSRWHSSYGVEPLNVPTFYLPRRLLIPL